MLLENEGKKFDVDIEKTKEYYAQHSLCDCVGCRNFYEQITQKYLYLNDFLQKFGIDISRPDELGWGDLSDGTLDYHFVAYTVCGSILEHDKYEIDIQDNTFVSIVADNNNAPPNEQKSDNYFVLMVYGIQLPYIINEPLVIETKPKKKLFDFFKRKD